MSEVVEVRTPGPVGPEGPQGPEGPAGPTGPDGRSAYQVAVDNGFVGTEAEWVASLEGPQGPEGPAGTDGGAGAFATDEVNGRIIPNDTGDGFVVGSDRFDRDATDTSKDTRMFFSKVKSAFRAGSAADEWDDANVGEYSAAFGRQVEASGEGSVATGYLATASGSGSTARGLMVTASGPYAHAEGYGTQATALTAHAEGNGAQATSSEAHAEGYYTVASGSGSHTEGYYSEAGGDYSHAEGFQTTASGSYSHAEGASSVASGRSSHAEGEATAASGSYSHAEGFQSYADASFSEASGHLARATAYAQRARAAGAFYSLGDAQVGEYVARKQTADATPSLLTFDNVAARTAAASSSQMGPNVLVLQAKTLVTFRIVVSARRTDVDGEMAGFVLEGVVGRDASGNARIIGTPSEQAWGDAGTELWVVDLAVNTADASFNYLEINVTGEAGKTIRWVAGINTTEVRS